jgi:hypothetical protein
LGSFWGAVEEAFRAAFSANSCQTLKLDRSLSPLCGISVIAELLILELIETSHV